MLKSLYSGISGLQSQQIAMDIESNNIANVSTIGYKYSRANFSDLLAQTSQISTAPQGELGGKNAVQIGLGTTVNSVTRIHSQGSIQNTDKNTDVAIQGDGFFVVSADGGNTYKYSRSGDFKFDAAGNFVDNNGFIVQGWARDKTTGLVDATAPITNINVPPGMTTPASASSEITIKANLSSSELVTQFAPTRALDSVGGITVDPITGLPTEKTEDMGVMFNSAGEAMQLTATDATDPANPSGGQGMSVSFDGGVTTQNFRYTTDTTLAGTVVNGQYFFRTTEDLRAGLQAQAAVASPAATVSINALGKFEISNGATGTPLTITIASISDGTTVANTRFTDTFTTLGGSLPADATKQTQSINAATHSTSIDVFDSLGSKHTVKIDFRKQSVGATTDWDYTISVPLPGSIGGIAPNQNILEGGTISFNSNGAMMGATIPSITFSPNNGASGNQTIAFNFGVSGSFGGVTSFDNPSATSGISQDGYPGGDLVGIRIDQSGTLIGSFSNGRSFGLAQIGMAKFTNNEGLVSDGGNTYLQSANSGEPIIGTAATAGRGFMQASSLEASNVDLSKSLTNLIIIQRGYQANGKTITTSDTLLETLLGIKR